MDFVLTGVKVYRNGCFQETTLSVKNASVSLGVSSVGQKKYDFNNCYVFPGFADVHVHLRDPGFSYKETIKSGAEAAASMGYTSLCAMPNLNPVPDCPEHVRLELAKIQSDSPIEILPYGAITKSEEGLQLSDMQKIAEHVCAFSDDGRGVQSAQLMERAMQCAKKSGKIIAAHCEDNSLLCGGCIHDGEYAKKNGYIGINSESEYKQVERDILLAKKTGVSYHVCHISTKESVELIRLAKAEGIDITCETAPHYLVLNDSCLKNEGRFKMNPPIRSEQDRQALLEGILDGTIDMIATDHAPHSMEEKSKGLQGSLMGVTGLETAFPILYTKLVKTRIISLERLIALMSVNPAKRFGLNTKGINFCVYDLNKEYTICPEIFHSKGKATPFEGENVFGKCLMTVANGKIVYATV